MTPTQEELLTRGELDTVGRSVVKVDGEKLVRGCPVYTDDVHPEGLAVGRILRSPHAHARLRALVAAETRDIADEALRRIRVDYEVLPAVFDPEAALRPGAPILHDETDSTGIFDRGRNLAARMEFHVGDVERGLAEADVVFERTYTVQPIHAVSLEPHVVITWLDEDDRLVVRTSTQVPFDRLVLSYLRQRGLVK